MSPVAGQEAAPRNRRRLWSAPPALLAAGLLAAGTGGADAGVRAERAVAARLSWCGIDPKSVTIEGVLGSRLRAAPRSAQVVTIALSDGRPAPPSPGSGGGGSALAVAVAPDTSGGWHISPSDDVTSAALGSCLDH